MTWVDWFLVLSLVVGLAILLGFEVWPRLPARVQWYLRQALPLTYRTTYWDDAGEHMAVWRMWLGQVFEYDDVVIGAWYRKQDRTSRDKPLLWYWKHRKETTP